MEQLVEKIKNIENIIKEKNKQIEKLNEDLRKLHLELDNFKNNDENFNKIINLFFLGSGGSGKNTLSTLLCQNRFESKYIPTMSLDVDTFILDDIKIKITCVAGRQENNSFGNIIYLKCQYAILFVDLSCPDGLKKLKYFHKNVLEVSPNAKIAVIMNKIDLSYYTNPNSIETYCNNKKIKYIKISCKNNFNYDDVYKFILNML